MKLGAMKLGAMKLGAMKLGAPATMCWVVVSCFAGLGGILRVLWRGSWAEMPLKGGGDFSIVIGKHNELLFRESWR